MPKSEHMPRRYWGALAGAGSGALLAGAFAFEYIGGLLPCTLCIWQRWPHAAAVFITVLAVFAYNRMATVAYRLLALLGAFAVLISAGIALFHVGVEQSWWQGLASCTINSLAGVSASDLLSLDTDVGAPASCDAVAWQMLGISMAGWNGLASLGLCAVWLRAARG
ncbi:MAG: disulfide bond formation protein B [Cypionkella sp.]